MIDMIAIYKDRLMSRKVKQELPNKKLLAQIFDMDTLELLVSADLTPAATRRFMKHYTALGFNVRAVWNGSVEVIA